MAILCKAPCQSHHHTAVVLLWLPDLCLSYFHLKVVYFRKFNLSFFIVSKWLFPKSQMSFWPHFRPSAHLNPLYLLNCFWQCLHKNTFSSLLRFLQSLGVPPPPPQCQSSFHSLKLVQLPFSWKLFQSLFTPSMSATVPPFFHIAGWAQDQGNDQDPVFPANLLSLSMTSKN